MSKYIDEKKREFLQKRGVIFLDDEESYLIVKCYFLNPKLDYLFVKDFAKKYKIDSILLYEILREVEIGQNT